MSSLQNLEKISSTSPSFGIAVADAFIGCWQIKYTYNLLRPVTYIRQFVDAIWPPFIVTPGAAHLRFF